MSMAPMSRYLPAAAIRAGHIITLDGSPARVTHIKNAEPARESTDYEPIQIGFTSTKGTP